MRIISGNRRGHKLVGFEGENIRPTTDRVKESVFNLIQGFIADSSVLDLFAGSGALGFEAMSRGASEVIFVDAAKASVEVVSKNASSLNFGDNVRILNMTYQEFFKTSKDSFDIIFLDPPYNKGFIEPVLVDIVENNRLNDGGIIVLESDDTDMHSEFDGLSVLKQKKYGRSYITVYQRR
ncbi:MAG: 16S rRNA (guanine(966)-N(2))-methyltransferase RsmD [Clostridia bacterium]|nr:16S rRNA (guanine(966)-N(2))-methyltransferase RsmD [Clostridia bacterium]